MSDADLEAEVERAAKMIVEDWGGMVLFGNRVKSHVAARLIGITYDGLMQRVKRSQPPFPKKNGKYLTFFIRDCIARDPDDLVA